MPRLKELPSQLVRPRQHSGLTQQELGLLLGTTRSSICKFEAQRVMPSFGFILAIEAIFGLSAREAFPESYTAIHHEVVRRAAELDLMLRAKPGPGTARKLAFLSAIQGRDGTAGNASRA
jgi:transcriptional regulator with XRE-family HTH domain